MTLNSSPMYQRFRRFLACEDGNSTIEALFFYIPIFLFLLASIEIGILSTRHVLLERGVDLAVRQVRIGALKDADGKGPGIDTVRTAICNYSGVIPDCLDSVKIKIVKMDVRNWARTLMAQCNASTAPNQNRFRLLLRMVRITNLWFSKCALCLSHSSQPQALATGLRKSMVGATGLLRPRLMLWSRTNDFACNT